MAWVLFAIVLQAYVNDSYRSGRTALSALRIRGDVVAILGIHHV